MSRITSFEIVAPRGSAAQLVRAVIAHLAAEDKDRLLRALETGSEQLMRDVDRNVCDAREGSDLCLTFLFPPDELLRVFESDSELVGDAATGRVAVRCSWSGLDFGEYFVKFHATSFVWDICNLFFESSSVLDSFIDIAKQTPGATLARYDDVLERDDLIWRAPDAAAYALSCPRAAEASLVDLHCWEILDAVA
ncbi:MAG: hypothetical protein PHP57_05645 [Sideroxydans sp.]|nr:hypothetical protein [Sideroxydans sp.]